MTTNTIYAKFDDSGFPVGYWQSAAYDFPDDVIPNEAIELTVDQFEELYNNQGYRRWINGQVVEYTPPPPTIEEQRAAMPRKSMVELRAALRRIRTPLIPDGIYAADINAKINQIADLNLQEEARDYFNLGQYAERINPWVDILGFMFGLSPEAIDAMWIEL